MRAPSVKELDVPANSSPGFENVRVGTEIGLLIFDRPPEALHDDVVSPGAFAIHADLHACFGEDLRELQAGELAALIGIEDLRPPETGKSFFYRLDAERRFQRDRYTPRQDPSRVSVDDRSQINEPPGHRDVCIVRGPDLVRPVDHKSPQQISEPLMSDVILEK